MVERVACGWCCSYLPAAALMLVYLGFSSGSVKIDLPLVEQREILDRIWDCISDRHVSDRSCGAER